MISDHHVIELLKSCDIPSRYVFDGKPPEMKSVELGKRAEKREEAKKDLEKAQERGERCHVVSSRFG